jgi:DNA-binding beta-propeller fold protein YncE
VKINSKLLSIATVSLCVASSIPLSAQSDWQVKKTLHIGGGGGWDYLTVDSQTHRLFVPRGTHTMVLDEKSGKLLGDIPGQKVAHGVAIVPSLGRGFITDGGGSGSIVVFDLKSYEVLGMLPAWPDADGIIYDADQNLVLAVSGDKGLLMTFKPDIDPKSGKIGPPIALGGSPEFLASNGKGKIFINIEDKDLVAVVDLQSRQVIARWPVAPGGHPVGMALDRKTNRLFVGCRKPQKMVVISAESGQVLDALPIGDGVDATAVDAGRAFASCRDGSFTVVTDSTGKYKVAQVVKTPFGARTMGVDPATHTIYLPTSEFESQPANSTSRPKQKPNTFMIVEVGK